MPLIKGAIEHKGAAFLDVISPCVAFNNHPGSTKSYDYVRQHNEAVNRIDFVESRSEITADYAPGELLNVTQKYIGQAIDGEMPTMDALHKLAEEKERILKGAGLL